MMKNSGSYVIVEAMIRENQIRLSELETWVNSLERIGLITSREHKALLQLAKKILPKPQAASSLEGGLVLKLRRAAQQFLSTE
jgi:hypothetical protein